jgi:hypothetical protein
MLAKEVFCPQHITEGKQGKKNHTVGGWGIYFPQVLSSLTCKIRAKLEKSVLVFPPI